MTMKTFIGIIYTIIIET